MMQAAKDAVGKRSDEDKEIEIKKTNVVMYRVPQNFSEEIEIRKSSDNFFLSSLCEVLGIDPPAHRRRILLN